MGKLTKAALWVFVINIMAKILGLLKETAIAYKFGTSYIVDAYTVAITFPSVLFAIFASGIAESYIPILTRINDEEKRNELTNSIINIITVISFGIVMICLLFNDEIVRVLAPGFQGNSYFLTKKMINIVTLTLPVMVVYNILNAMLTMRERFIFVNFVNSILLNILIISSVLIASENTPCMLVIGYVVSNVIVLCVFEIYSMKQTTFRHTLVFDYKTTEFKELICLAIPLGVSLIANQINSMVDRALASGLGVGIIAALGYANKVQLLFYSLITTAIISVCYPRINKHFSCEEFDEGMNYVQKGIMLASYLGIPIAMIIFIYAEPITMLIFERGSFSTESTIFTSECLSFYALGIPFYSYREILLKALAAYKQQKTILKNTIISIVFNIVFNLALIHYLEHIGLALATSLAGCLAAILMYRDVRKNNLILFKKGDKKEIIQIIIISLIALVLSKGCFILMNYYLNEIMSFVFSIATFGITYFSMSYICKVNTLRWILFTLIKHKE